MEPNENDEKGTGNADRELGPDGGAPDDRERQKRGATPAEEAMDETLRKGAPQPRPPGTGTDGELTEPDAGVADAPGDQD